MPHPIHLHASPMGLVACESGLFVKPFVNATFPPAGVGGHGDIVVEFVAEEVEGDVAEEVDIVGPEGLRKLVAACGDVVAGTAWSYIFCFEVVGCAIVDVEGVAFEEGRAAFGADLFVGGEEVDGEVVSLQADSGRGRVGFWDFDVVVGDIRIDYMGACEAEVVNLVSKLPWKV